MSKWMLSLVGILVFGFASPTRAGMTASEALELSMQSNEAAAMLAKTFVFGLQEGYAWSNAFLYDRGSKRLYCQPDNLVLNAEQVHDILQRYVDELSLRGDLELGPALLGSLEYAFPCE